MRKRKTRGHTRCIKCSRPLSDPESRARGYGPTCFKRSPAVVQAELEQAGQLTFPPQALEFRR